MNNLKASYSQLAGIKISFSHMNWNNEGQLSQQLSQLGEETKVLSHKNSENGGCLSRLSGITELVLPEPDKLGELNFKRSGYI